MIELPEAARRLIEAPNLAHIATLMKHGGPQVTPVWVDHDGSHVLVNTAEGRQKTLNLRRDPRVALSIVDRGGAFAFVAIRGRVVEIIGGEAAWDHIVKLSQKYTGRSFYPRREGEARLILRIAPEHVRVATPRG